MTEEDVIRRVQTELKEAIGEALESVQTESRELSQTAINSIRRAQKESQLMKTPEEKELVTGVCTFIEDYLQMFGSR